MRRDRGGVQPRKLERMMGQEFTFTMGASKGMEEGKDHFVGLMEDSRLEAEDSLWKDCNGQRRIEAGQGNVKGES